MDILQFKNFDIQAKSKDAAGNLIISGYGAVFGNIDSYGEIIEKGAFIKTLKDRAGRIAFCYQHDIWNPIGKFLKIEEDDKGLFIQVMVSAAAPEIQTKIQEEILKEMSVGYRVNSARDEMQGDVKVRVLEEVELYEVSLVTIAANPLAVISEMKSDAERTDFLTKEFDRIISIIRNENINFELRKLKTLVLSGVATHREPHEDEAHLTASQIVELLNT